MAQSPRHIDPQLFDEVAQHTRAVAAAMAAVDDLMPQEVGASTWRIPAAEMAELLTALAGLDRLRAPHQRTWARASQRRLWWEPTDVRVAVLKFALPHAAIPHHSNPAAAGVVRMLAPRALADVRDRLTHGEALDQAVAQVVVEQAKAWSTEDAEQRSASRAARSSGPDHDAAKRAATRGGRKPSPVEGEPVRPPSASIQARATIDGSPATAATPTVSKRARVRARQ